MEHIDVFRKRHRDYAANGRTRVCDPPLFFKSYMPGWKPLPDDQMQELIENLCNSGAINADGEWHDLPTPPKHFAEDSSRNPLSEDSHFRHMEEVVEHIILAAEETVRKRFAPEKRTTEFMCRPRHITYSEVEGSSQRADSLFVRKQSSYPPSFQAGRRRTATSDPRVYTADITNAGEFKLYTTDKDIVNDQLKTFGHAAHIFFNDVGRSAVFTFTIEGSEMQIWYHTRSHTGVTARFDIYKDKRWFIEFVLFNTYASLAELGIDPTVRRVMDEQNKLQYQFDVYPTPTSRKAVTYQTRNLIDEASARTIYCRAMRVFDVRLVIVNADVPAARILADQSNVLRDHWVYDDVDDERKIQKDILDRLKKKLGGGAIWREVLRHFMRIEEDGVVRYMRAKGKRPVTVPAPPNTSEAFEYAVQENPSGSEPSAPQVTTGLRSDGATQVRLQTAPKAEDVPLLRLHGKKHCRTTYEQLCKDLHRIDNPALFFHALCEVVKILLYFKRIGYLHRDVSPGNFLLYHLSGTLPESLSVNDRAALEQWITIVSDLEYARPYYGGSGHDPITGTPYYTAVEVQSRQYRFKTGQKIMQTLDAEGVYAPKNFSFNFYHDLESVLWMALDFAIRKSSKALLSRGSGVGKETAEKLRKYARELFTPDIHGSRERNSLIEMIPNAQELWGTLSGIYGDSPISTIVSLIEDLQDAYRALEKTTAQSHQLDNGRTVFSEDMFQDDIYIKMEETFRKISDHYLNHPDTFVLVPPADKAAPTQNPPASRAIQPSQAPHASPPPSPSPVQRKKSKRAAPAKKVKTNHTPLDVLMQDVHNDSNDDSHGKGAHLAAAASATQPRGSRKRLAPQDDDEPKSKRPCTEGQSVRRSGRIQAALEKAASEKKVPGKAITGRRTR
ncbi:hypothetical protein BD626DRAFT_433267 [Schizophyllum amplum]|uniref:Fungal-type protein kinase domain-containing protein n=1 Tax=Schizophyllum amplum TaxID=97359 RepID=A0A550CC81_9AGAR|nr:hypothetical protein BD626DRAFT_433267 [Auriculariopsis ampla]